MALDDLKQVYQAVLLDYAASQKYRQPLASPTKAVSLVNESCGHTLVIHSEDRDVIRQFMLKKPVGRILIIHRQPLAPWAPPQTCFHP